MGALPTEIEDECRRDLRFAQEATESGVIPSRNAAARKDWTVWVAFCNSLHQDPLLPYVADKVRILQVFAHRVRIGKLARNTGGKPVRSRTVENYPRSVSLGFTSVGGPDPRHQPLTSQTYFCLDRQLRFYSKQDPSPSRVKPLPLSVLNNVHEMAALHGDVTSLAVSDLSFAAFYWLLRPGEYCSSSKSHPFRLCDVQLFIGEQCLDPCNCALVDLDRVTFVSLTLTTQKNGIRGKIIGHARFSHFYACPVVSILNRVRYLCFRVAPPPSTPAPGNATAATTTPIDIKPAKPIMGGLTQL
jgi:hypothetical protein